MGGVFNTFTPALNSAERFCTGLSLDGGTRRARRRPESLDRPIDDLRTPRHAAPRMRLIAAIAAPTTTTTTTTTTTVPWQNAPCTRVGCLCCGDIYRATSADIETTVVRERRRGRKRERERKRERDAEIERDG